MAEENFRANCLRFMLLFFEIKYLCVSNSNMGRSQTSGVVRLIHRKWTLNILQNSSIDNCLSSCKSNNSCSGATFDNINNSCTLSSGTGNIIEIEMKRGCK